MATPRHDLSFPDELERLAAVLDEPAGTLASVWAGHHLEAPVPATQLRVLFAVERHGSLNVTGVAEELGALLSSASRLCGRLESTGLLERVPGSDRRAIVLRLSSQGEEMLDDLRQARQRDLAEVLAAMDPQSRASLLTGLVQFRQAAALKAGEDSADFSMPA